MYSAFELSQNISSISMRSVEESCHRSRKVNKIHEPITGVARRLRYVLLLRIINLLLKLHVVSRFPLNFQGITGLLAEFIDAPCLVVRAKKLKYLEIIIYFPERESNP